MAVPTAYPLPHVMEAWDNRVVISRRRLAHVHGGHELTLIRDLGTTIIHCGTPVPAPPGTLFLHRHPEVHGIIGDGAPTRLMVLNFEPDERFEADLPSLGTAARRVWHLDDRQMATYIDLFTRIQVELDGRNHGREQAVSAWLRLILVLVARLDQPKASAVPDSGLMQPVDAEVNNLRRVIDLLRQGSMKGSLQEVVENYDVLRHRFRRTYGESPNHMLMRLRIEFACGCLTGGDAPMSEIASQVGYVRQHEFTRAFHRVMGCSPTAFRRQHRGTGATAGG